MDLVSTIARRPGSGQRIKVGMRPEHFALGTAPGFNAAARFVYLWHGDRGRGAAFLKVEGGCLPLEPTFAFRPPAAKQWALFPGDNSFSTRDRGPDLRWLRFPEQGSRHSEGGASRQSPRRC
jgi:hypothetical protein